MAVQLDLNKEVKLDLNKGITLDLKKGDFVNLSNNSLDSSVLRAGCGWNCRKVEKRGLFRSKMVSEDVDLDLVAVLEDANGTILNRVFFNRLQVPGLALDQDDRSGSDGYTDINAAVRSLSKDNENITIRLNMIAPQVQIIKIGVVIYNVGRVKQGLRPHTFEMIDSAYCKLVDETGKKVLCSVRMGENGGDHTAVVMAVLKRYQGQWVFEAAEDYVYADNVLDFH